MDRAFTVAGKPEEVWPWLVQLGKRRAGWYLPRPGRAPGSRGPAGRSADRPRWQGLSVGDVIPDYGGRDETFTVAEIEPAHHIVYTSRRGRTDLSWAIALAPYDEGRTRVQLRLRLHPVRRRWLADSVGGFFDVLTIAGMAAGLRERLIEQRD